MKYTKKDILRVAFDEFMRDGYKGSIIAGLQKKLGMSAGALYRHFKNKDELFKVVIDEYFFNVVERLVYKSGTEFTALDLIDSIYRRQSLMKSFLFKRENPQITYLNFYNLLIQAVKYYPGFIIRFNRIQSFIESSWLAVFKKGVETGELRDDIDLVAMSKIFTKMCFIGNSLKLLPTTEFVPNTKRNIEMQKQNFLILYGLMKK